MNQAMSRLSLCEILCLWNHRCGIVTTNTRCVVSSLVLMPVVLFLKSAETWWGSGALLALWANRNAGAVHLTFYTCGTAAAAVHSCLSFWTLDHRVTTGKQAQANAPVLAFTSANHSAATKAVKVTGIWGGHVPTSLLVPQVRFAHLIIPISAPLGFNVTHFVNKDFN